MTEVVPQNMIIGDWMLVVAHIHPHTYSSTSDHTNSGRYDSKGNRVGDIYRDFKWRAESTEGNHRTYLYYSTDPSTTQWWCYPRVDVVDGSEPSIDELLKGYDYLEYKGGDFGVRQKENEIIVNRFKEA